MTRLPILALLLATTLRAAGGPEPGARLEGRVIDLDGRRAQGFHVHLIDEGGSVVARATTASDGLYAFAGVSPGRYALGVESPAGRFAPAGGAPLRLGRGELARRDLRLQRTDLATRERTVAAHRGLLSWWGELSTAAKVWIVVVAVGLGGAGWAAATDDDDREQFASPTQMP